MEGRLLDSEKVKLLSVVSCKEVGNRKSSSFFICSFLIVESKLIFRALIKLCMKKTPKSLQWKKTLHKKIIVAYLWNSEKVAAIVNQIYKGEYITQSGVSLCYLPEKPRRD